MVKFKKKKLNCVRFIRGQPKRYDQKGGGRNWHRHKLADTVRLNPCATVHTRPIGRTAHKF